MASPIRFYLDFASPYSYFALDPIARLAAENGRDLEIRPVMVWAILRHHGVANPLEKPGRRAYFLQDVARSADYFGVPFRLPEPLQISAHLASRLFYALTAEAPERAQDLAREIYRAFFVDGLAINDPQVLAGLPSLAGRNPDEVKALLDGPVGRERLAAAIEDAIAAGAVGAPFTVVDGEGFFGADRLPQIAWRLAGGGTGSQGRG